MIMKSYLFALAATVAFGWPTIAAATQHNGQMGHYEWQSVKQFTPKAGLEIRRQVWVPDMQQMADCKCDMRQMSISDCMRGATGQRS